MDNPERHLVEWFAKHFYGGDVSSDVVKTAADSLSEFMRERGWQFEPVK